MNDLYFFRFKLSLQVSIEGRAFAARTLERELVRMDTLVKKVQLKVFKFYRYLLREDKIYSDEGDMEKLEAKITKLAGVVIRRQKAQCEEEKQRRALMMNPVMDGYQEQKNAEGRVRLFLESLYESLQKPYYHYV
jgi:hypothetical protein